MALTKVAGDILDPGIVVAGIVTATGFSGPFSNGTTGNFSGDVTVGGSLIVQGDQTTLNTTLRNVELLRVAANSSTAAGIITQTGSGDILNLFDGTAEVFSVADGGNVEINAGNLTLVKSSGALLELTTNTGAADATLRLSEGSKGSTTNGGGMFYSGADNKLYVTCGTDSTTKRITVVRDSGNVGINTTTPQTELEVFSDTSSDITIHSARTSGTLGGINFANGASATGIVTAQYFVGTAGHHYWHCNGTERLKLENDGDLTITGVDNAELKLKCGASTGNNILAFLNSAGATKGRIFYDSDNNFMVFNTDGTSDERMRITNAGAVGIGTNDPDTRLSVTAAVGTDVVGKFTSTDANAWIQFRDNTTTDTGVMVGANGDDLLLRAGSNTRLRILSTGHIVPNAAGTQNLGSTAKEWGDVFLASDKALKLGNSQIGDLYVGSDNVTYLRNSTGQMVIRAAGDIYISDYSGNHRAGFRDNSAVDLYFDIENHTGPKLSTTATGISVGGEVAATQDYPNYRPTLDFNFAAVKKLDSRITYSRTGPASFTDEFGKVVLVGDNVPRFDHDPTTRECKGLLIEESRTNLFASSDAGNSVWILNNGITKEANTTDTKDPAGTFTACKLMSVASAGSASQIYDGMSHGSGGVQSLWAKKGTHNVLGIFDYGGGSGIRGWFDLNTGEHRCEGGTKVAAGVQSNGNDTNHTNMIEYPNGWYRCIYYEAANMTYAHFRIVDFDSDTEASASSNSIYLWGLQAEGSGQKFATSHIPCDTGVMPGTITRGVDLYQITGEDFSDFYNQSEGTIVSEHSIATGVANGDNTYVYQIDDGSDTNVGWRLLDHNSAHGDLLRAYGFVGGAWGSPQYGFDASTPAHNTFLKVALGMKNNDFGVNFFGGTTATDTSGSVTGNGDMIQLTIGNHRGGTAPLQGYIRRFIYYPQKLTTNQLKTITS